MYVKYSNKFNDLDLTELSLLEQRFLFAIIAKMGAEKLDGYSFTGNELEQLIDYKKMNNKRFADTIKSMCKKINGLTIVEENEYGFDGDSAFGKYAARHNPDYTDLLLIIKVSDKFKEIIYGEPDGFTTGFTSFKLDDFLKLKTTYSQTLFRLLIQWKTVGKISFSKAELFDKLNVPEKYAKKMSNFRTWVLNPTITELNDFFHCLDFETQKTGRSVSGYTFKFKAYVPNDAKPTVDGFKSPYKKKPIRVEMKPDYSNEEKSSTNEEKTNRTVGDILDLDDSLLTPAEIKMKNLYLSVQSFKK